MKPRHASKKWIEADRLLRRHSRKWMALEGVVACAVGLRNLRDRDSVVLKIYVRRLDLPSLRVLPKRIDGFDVLLEQSGLIRSM